MELRSVLTAVTLALITTSSVSADARKTWTAAEILSERKTPVTVQSPKFCQGGAFKPCICPADVTKLVQYRPAVKECQGRAAIVLSGKYTSVYSAVVRDRENKDRWPPEGANGCTKHERDDLGLNKCSVFKVQKVIEVEDDNGPAKVECLGASGYTPLFKNVRRITIKLRDVPGSNTDPLLRLCLVGPKDPLN